MVERLIGILFYLDAVSFLLFSGIVLLVTRRRWPVWRGYAVGAVLYMAYAIPLMRTFGYVPTMYFFTFICMGVSTATRLGRSCSWPALLLDGGLVIVVIPTAILWAARSVMKRRREGASAFHP